MLNMCTKLRRSARGRGSCCHQTSKAQTCCHDTNTHRALAAACASLTCTLPLMLFQSCLAELRVCCAAREILLLLLLLSPLRHIPAQQTFLKTKCGRVTSARRAANISCDLWTAMQSVSEKWVRATQRLICWSLTLFSCQSITPSTRFHSLPPSSSPLTDCFFFSPFSPFDYVRADECSSAVGAAGITLGAFPACYKVSQLTA